MRPVELAFEKGYRVSECGRIVGRAGRVVKVRPNRDGYLYFGIRISGRRKKSIRVHRLQAFQLFGVAIFSPNTEVRHMDGNRQNNSRNNLILGTAIENAADKTPLAKAAGGMATAKYDHAAVRSYYSAHGWIRTIRQFGLGKGTLSFILNKSRAALTPGPTSTVV